MEQKIPTRRLASSFFAVGLATALLSGCAAAGTADATAQPSAGTQADALQISESWIKAANEGMTGGFVVLENPTDQPASLVKVDSDHAGSVELHDMEGSGTAMSMKELDGPLEIPAYATVELAPGGKHVMLMGLKQELKAGESTAMTFTFGDGSTREVPFEIKSYTGAKESYTPAEKPSGHDASSQSSEHAGH